MLAPRIIDFPYQPNAETLFEAIRDLPDAIWFDSGKPRSLQGRYDIITASPHWRLSAPSGPTTADKAHTQIFSQAQDMLEELGTLGDNYSHHPFVGALAGYFSYDSGQPLVGVPNKLSAVTTLPNVRLGCYTWALVLNHQSQMGWLLFHPACPSVFQTDIQKRLQSAQTKPEVGNKFKLLSPFGGSTNQEEYLRAITRIKNYIAAGDCYQVNLSQHFSAAFEGDSWQAYRALRQVLPSPYSTYMAWESPISGNSSRPTKTSAILSLSPERFLKVSVGQVESKPIKGTIRRGTSVADDENHAVTLMNSTKDRAENLMIVDLLRNDLGKVCQPGSIRVPKLFALETFANVHHLVSTVTGTLADTETPLSLLKACLPGGSITGAPKKRAMEIIQELEPCQRSLYCGSIGYISTTGRMDTNIAIRTLLADDGQLHCWGGGGIVADSDPASEYEESLNKVRLLMQTLENL